MGLRISAIRIQLFQEMEIYHRSLWMRDCDSWNIVEFFLWVRCSFLWVYAFIHTDRHICWRVWKLLERVAVEKRWRGGGGVQVILRGRDLIRMEVYGWGFPVPVAMVREERRSLESQTHTTVIDVENVPRSWLETDKYH